MLLGIEISLCLLCCSVEWWAQLLSKSIWARIFARKCDRVSLEGKERRVHIKSGYFKLDHSWYNLIPWRNSWDHLHERFWKLFLWGTQECGFPLHWEEEKRAHPSFFMALNIILAFFSFPFFSPFPLHILLIFLLVFLPGSSFTSKENAVVPSVSLHSVLGSSSICYFCALTVCHREAPTSSTMGTCSCLQELSLECGKKRQCARENLVP